MSTASLALREAVFALPQPRTKRAEPPKPAASKLTIGTLRRTTFRDLFVDHGARVLTALWWTHFLKLAFLEIGEALGLAKAAPDARAVDFGTIPYVLQVATAWTFPNGARTKLLDGTFDIDSDSWKLALFLSTSNIGATTTTYAGVSNEVATAFGYTQAGIAVTLTLAGTTTVTVDISTDPVWTASGGSITARFAAIYEVSGNVLCYSTCDSTPADVSATDGNTFTVAANASGVFTLA